jgi:uncharacterized protein DUF955
VGKLGFVPYPDILDLAWQLLGEHGVQDTIPVDVELLIEQDLGVDIVPVPGLQRDFSVEGFTSSDFTTIHVDLDVLNNVEVRYRFTLAHEVGHLVMHREFLSQWSIADLEDWGAFMRSVDPGEYSTMEIQGYLFGGALLMPEPLLRPIWERQLPAIRSLCARAKASGFTVADYAQHAFEAAAPQIAPVFNVSREAVVKRLSTGDYSRTLM